MIAYVSFTHPIQVGGDNASITYWSKTVHANSIEVVEKGPYIVLRVKASGDQFRVPLSAINYIKDVEGGEPVKVEKVERKS